MRLYELFEDAMSDHAQIQTARAVLKGLVGYIEKKGVDNLRTQEIRAHEEHYLAAIVPVSDIRLEYGREFNNLRIVFVKNFTGKKTSMAGYAKSTNSIYIFVDPFDPDSLPFAEQVHWHEMFIHEFIHMLDFIRAPNMDANIDQSKQSYEDYINSPAEFNAHYQQAINNFREFVENTRESNPSRYEEVASMLFGNKARFMDYIMGNSGLSEKLNDKYLKKMKKRLSKYYDEYHEEFLKADGE